MTESDIAALLQVARAVIATIAPVVALLLGVGIVALVFDPFSPRNPGE